MSDVVKSQRELLLVINLVDQGQDKWRWLYQWLDANAEAYTLATLTQFYNRISVLKGPAATCQVFIQELTEMASQPHVKALDVFLHLHGGKRKLWFEDGVIGTDTLRDQIKVKSLGHRLRLLYSVACYGETHAQDFVDAGFRTASGARGVNANSTHDYPTQLALWSSGSYYKTAVQQGNNPPLRLMHDNAARLAGFPDADSEKFIRGKMYTRITSEAT